MDVWGTYAAGFAEPASGRYAQTVAPIGEPLSVPEARQQCSILDTSWDDYLARLITECREILEKRLSRQFLPATWTHSLDAFPDEIQLEVLPVTAVTKIHYIDYAGNPQDLPANQYQVDISSPDRPCRIRPVWGLVWPITRVGTFNAVVTTFTAGYADAPSVPAAAKRAMKLLIAHAFQHREPITDEAVNQVLMSMDWAADAAGTGIYA
jgi:uncharacterized phiE125 gp8 family phage protein